MKTIEEIRQTIDREHNDLHSFNNVSHSDVPTSMYYVSGYLKRLLRIISQLCDRIEELEKRE